MRTVFVKRKCIREYSSHATQYLHLTDRVPILEVSMCRQLHPVVHWCVLHASIQAVNDHAMICILMSLPRQTAYVAILNLVGGSQISDTPKLRLASSMPEHRVCGFSNQNRSHLSIHSWESCCKHPLPMFAVRTEAADCAESKCHQRRLREPHTAVGRGGPSAIVQYSANSISKQP